MEPLPHDICEKIVQCFGRCFHYKDGVTSFLVSAGIDRTLACKHSHLAKFVWARQLLLELAGTENGRLLQRKILTALCNLREITDPDVSDKSAAIAAINDLKRTAIERHLVKQKVREEEKRRREEANSRAQLVVERKNNLQNLRDRFAASFDEKNRQRAGYELESILKELFLLSEIEFTPSYRTATAQVDGHFRFEGFDYLVEAKWRSDQPTQKDIGGFKEVVCGNFDSTRGIFISVVGFRDEVIAHFSQAGARVILLDGEHLMHLLDGRIDLQEGLRYVIVHAATHGKVYAKFSL